MLLLPARLHKAVGVAGWYLLREAPGTCFGEGLVLWAQCLVLYSTDAFGGLAAFCGTEGFAGVPKLFMVMNYQTEKTCLVNSHVTKLSLTSELNAVPGQTEENLDVG